MLEGDLEEDEAASDFQRLLKLNSKKSKVTWNKISSNFKNELLEFQQIESGVYPDGFLAANSNCFSSCGENSITKDALEEEEEEDEEVGGNVLLVQEALVPKRSIWKSPESTGVPAAAEKQTDLYSYHYQNDLQETEASVEEMREDRVLLAEESCLQIISKDQLLGNSQLFEQSFSFQGHDQNDSDFAVLGSRASIGDDDRDYKLLHTGSEQQPGSEQALIQKYFKQSHSHNLKPADLRKAEVENNTKIKDLEAIVSDLTRELAKARQQTNKFRRERDEWERKEAAARNEKDQQYKWVSQEMSQLKEEHLKEVKKLKRERKDWETQKKLSELLPTKREREELEALKQQFQEQYAKWKDRDARMILAQDRLKKKVFELEKQNKELAEEVKFLEKDRALQKQAELSVKSNIPVFAAPANGNLVPTRSSTKSQNLKAEFINSDKKKSSLKENSLNGSALLNPEWRLNKPSSARPLTLDTSDSSNNRTLKKASRESVYAIGGKVGAVSKADNNDTIQTTEPKRITEFDAAKTDLDQLQRELGLGKPMKSESSHDGSRERSYADGSRILWCLDGTMRFFSSDNISVIYYSNGDSKTVYPDKRKVYWYNAPKTKHTTFPDGVQVCEFEDGQIEKRYPDNTLIVEFPDRTVKTIAPNGTEKVQYPDGMVQQITENGARIYTTYPDGVIELVTEDVVSKLYKNGIIKMSFPDGSEETRWPNGQIRIKDAQGRINMAVK